MRKEYTTVDLLKFFFSICIVGLHTSLLHSDESFPAWLACSLVFRTAVPYFFIISGYFLAGKIYVIERIDRKNIRAVTRNYCNKLLPPLAFWGTLGLFIDLANQLRKGTDVRTIILYICKSFFYPRNAMWFLLALIIGTILLTELYLRVKRWYICWMCISVVGYAIVLLCNNYYFIVESTFLGNIARMFINVCSSARNGIFFAPCFIGVGFVIRADRVQKALYNHRIVIWVGMVLGVVLLLSEASFIYDLSYLDDRGVFVSQLLLVPCIAVISIMYQVKMPLPYKRLRRLSSSIYYIHRTARVAVLLIPFYNGNTTILFFATLLLTLLVAAVSYQMKNEKIHMIFG